MAGSCATGAEHLSDLACDRLCLGQLSCREACTAAEATREFALDVAADPPEGFRTSAHARQAQQAQQVAPVQKIFTKLVNASIEVYESTTLASSTDPRDRQALGCNSYSQGGTRTA